MNLLRYSLSREKLLLQTKTPTKGKTVNSMDIAMALPRSTPAERAVRLAAIRAASPSYKPGDAADRSVPGYEAAHRRAKRITA